MKQGYKVTLAVLTIMILITLTIGTSYSFYSVQGKQEEANEFKSTCFKISFTDQDYISLNSDGKFAYPIDDNKVDSLTPYSFTIENTCTADNSNEAINYQIVLNALKQDVSETSKGDLTEYLYYKLDENPGKLLKNESKYSTPSYLPSEYKNNVKNSYLLTSGTLEHNASKTFNLRLWIPANACEGNDCQSSIMGKTFEGKILVITSQGVASERNS